VFEIAEMPNPRKSVIIPEVSSHLIKDVFSRQAGARGGAVG
jgi:hypothetical protein